VIGAPLPPNDWDADEPQPVVRASGLWRSLRLDPSFWVGGALVAIVVLAALLAPFLAPHSPSTQFDDGITQLGEPLGHTVKFPLGTDFEGRDVLSRLLYGARLSLAISLLGNTLAVVLGVTLGSSAAWWGGWAERVIMRVTDVMLAFPSLLLALALVGIRGPSLGVIVVVIAMVSWTGLCRISYGQVLALKQRTWVEAARASGLGDIRILFRQVLPHLIAPISVYATLGVALTIVFEGSLAYLGLGVPNPSPSWGRMIHDGSDPNALTYYWLIVFPGAALVLTVLGFNLLGDAIRDSVDPQSRGSG
jgi:peptide/nickel transport system permease protein